MKRTFTLPSLMLTSATANTSAQSAEFASADCVTGLNEIGLICVNNISGSQQDVEHAIAVQADEQGASGIASSRCTRSSSRITGGYRPFFMPEAPGVRAPLPVTVSRRAFAHPGACRRAYRASSGTRLQPAAVKRSVIPARQRQADKPAG